MAVQEKVGDETSTPQIAVTGSGTGDAEALRQEIALRAYYRYCERGCAAGCDVEDWLAAEQEVLAAHAKPTASIGRTSADDHRGRRERRSRR